GRVAPELGGSQDHLDIQGVNYYGVNQSEYQHPANVLPEDNPRRVPLSNLLIRLHERYERPMIIAETASIGDDRPAWIRKTAAQCLRAIDAGVDLRGICIYPIIGMADWHSLEFRPMGIWDQAAAGTTARPTHGP